MDIRWDTHYEVTAMKDPKTTLIAGLGTVLLITLAGLVHSRWQLNRELSALRGEDDSAKPQLLSKLEDLAEQQNRNTAPTPLFDPAFDPFGSSLFDSDPFARLQQMQSKLDQLFNNMSSRFGISGFTAAFKQPEIAVQESDEEFRVVITLAAGSEVELSTQIENTTLSISAQIRTTQQISAGGKQTSSVRVSQFSRAIDLGEPVDATGVKTETSAEEIVITVQKKSPWQAPGVTPPGPAATS